MVLLQHNFVLKLKNSETVMEHFTKLTCVKIENKKVVVCVPVITMPMLILFEINLSTKLIYKTLILI